MQWNEEPRGEFKEEMAVFKDKWKICVYSVSRKWLITICGTGSSVHRMNEEVLCLSSYLWLFMVLLLLVSAGVGMSVEWLKSLRNENLDPLKELISMGLLMCLPLAMLLWLLQLISSVKYWERKHSVRYKGKKLWSFLVILPQCKEDTYLHHLVRFSKNSFSSALTQSKSLSLTF